MKLMLPVLALLLLAGCDAQTYLECSEHLGVSSLTVIDAATGDVLTETTTVRVDAGSALVSTDGNEIQISGGSASLTIEHDGYEEQAFLLSDCPDDSDFIIELIAL